jgi:hypothetical protein
MQSLGQIIPHFVFSDLLLCTFERLLASLKSATAGLSRLRGLADLCTTTMAAASPFALFEG